MKTRENTYHYCLDCPNKMKNFKLSMFYNSSCIYKTAEQSLRKVKQNGKIK